MNIFVLTKQVPDTSEIKIDPVKNTLIREGVESILNPYDACALEKALQLKDKNPEIKIYAISMGPPQAEPMLKDCIAVGAEDAYLVTDRKFGGSDTLATSYILASAIEKIQDQVGKADLIFAGKQAIDGDTAQVGPEIAEHLDIPQITYGIDSSIEGDKIQVVRQLDLGDQVVEASFPALVTFTKTDDLRFPSMKNKLKARKAEVKQITFEDMPEIDQTQIGLKGSPTRVRKTYTPSVTKEGLIIEGKETPEAVSELVEALEKVKLF